MLKTILIVESNRQKRKKLSEMLSGEYRVVQAENENEAFRFLCEYGHEVTGIVLDLDMASDEGFWFLKQVHENEEYKKIPIIVSTEQGNREDEVMALERGAWDYLSQPYEAAVLRFRLKNAIERSLMSSFEQLKYLAEYDTLTGIYSKKKFFEATKIMLDKNPKGSFVFIRFDIDRFQLINSFYGMEEGDKLLCYLADHLRRFLKLTGQACTYGRMEADIFVCCCAYRTKEWVVQQIERVKTMVKAYNNTFDIVPIFGLYFLDDLKLPVDCMLDRATLAAKRCKGNYIDTVGIYTPLMSRELEQEQEIINEMAVALEEEQFCVYLQPRYSLSTNTACGAEALVRWDHPKKGQLQPGVFVPVFEKNGFISKLDFYVWNKVCQELRRWISAGIPIFPVSVNVSRVNLYNPRIVEDICGILEKYRLPPKLLQLELTESAYTDNPQMMKQVVKRLRQKGFSILMDDFGSGYSSLSILKDIEVDELKIDMRFLEKTDIPGRGENITASIVRMAKWLNIPTVAEGVEKGEQVEFLKSIGCDYAQGFYFAKPMPIRDYERLVRINPVIEIKRSEHLNLDGLWSSNPQVEVLFSNATQASCIYEFENEHIEILRVNKVFHELFCLQDMSVYDDPIENVLPEFRDDVLEAFHKSIAMKGFAECEYRRRTGEGKTFWVNLKLQYIDHVGAKEILFGSLFDITNQKNVEQELKKYRNAVSQKVIITNQMLIIDDSPLNRKVLESIFENRFTLLEAENGQEALEILKESKAGVDIILLDIMMPVMDGIAFLEYKKNHEAIADIPIIMITSDSTPQQQIKTLSMGADDYIVKPFVKEIVEKRVENVLESRRRMREILKEYQTVKEQAESDPLTQLYNRSVAQRMITSTLAVQAGRMHAFVLIDLDDFKKVNDRYGHNCGDMVLIEFAEALKRFFRKTDLISRFGGDEFCAFLANVPSEKFVFGKCMELCKYVRQMEIGEEKIHPSCSVGIAVSTADSSTFETLYKNADSALYESKRLGKNVAALYGYHTTMPVEEQLVSKEWLLDTLDAAVFIIDDRTLDILYMSNGGLRLCGCTSYSGKKCYEVNFNRQNPCSCCKRKSFTYESYNQYFIENRYLGKKLISKNKRINFRGHSAFLQLVTDVTDLLETGLSGTMEEMTEL